MVIKANKHADGIGGHLSTFASSRQPLRGRLQPLLPGQGRRPARRPGLHPGPRRAGHLRPGVPRRPPRPRTTSTTSAARSAASGLSSLPAPAAHARLLGVPDGVDGPRPDQRDLPGPLQPLPAEPPASTTRRDSQVWCFLGDGECDEPETLGALSLAARENARQPDLRRQLQPAAPRRPGARQRQDHPGARGRVPRRGLERHQGHLGLEVGRAAAPRRRRRAPQQDEHDRRRRVPALRGRVRRLHPRALLRPRPSPAASWSSTSPTTSCATCPAAGTTTASSTPPTRPRSSTRAAHRRSSSPRRSRAGRSAPTSRAATPRTRSRR